MQTQRDHVHAHQVLVGRMVNGLVLADPSELERPGRRSLIGLVIGLVIAIIGVVGCGVIGLLFPSDDGSAAPWRSPGSIILVKDTGGRFVYLAGKLRPVLNMTSARLLEAGKNPHVVVVNEGALSGVPRGEPLGIPGAPQVLPRQLSTGPWLLCLPGHRGAGSPSGTALPVAVNLDPAAPSARIPDGSAVLVSDSDGGRWLLLGGIRHKVGDPSVLVALGVSQRQPAAAPAAWLSRVPEGMVIAAADIPGAGSGSQTIGDEQYPVGQLFTQQAVSGAEQRFVLLRDGLAPVTGVEFALLAARHPERAPVQLDARAVVSAPHAPEQQPLGAGLPDLAGVRIAGRSEGTVCLRQRGRQGKLSGTLVLAPGAGNGARISLPPGGGMLVSPAPVDGGTGFPDTVYLVAGSGTKYPVPGKDALRALGYRGEAIVPFPGELLNSLPTGPALSPTTVRTAGKR